MMMQSPDGAASARPIELRVDRIATLFDVLDPFPIPSRDLARGTEDFVVGWARELNPKAPLKIIVHALERDDSRAQALQQAFAHYFTYRAERTQNDLNELFRVGRRSFLIGVVVLAACTIVAHLISVAFGDGYAASFFTEGLFILGWVANWRPMEIFLYDWWPLERRRKLFLRLAQATVELRADPRGASR